MATNLYFSDKVVSEQRLYEDIVIESLKMYGQDVYYLPRTIVDKDEIFNEDIPSQFSNAYKVEMYIENVDGFDGEGDLFTKFGVEIRDEATFIVARKRFLNTAAQFDNEIDGERPREGDLIYLPLSKSLFEISHVEDEQPFYQIANLPTYKCRATLFEYSGEDLDTGVIDIDNIEVDNTYQYVLYFTKPVTALATTTIDADGAVDAVTITDSGDGYRENFPDLTFSAPTPTPVRKFGNGAFVATDSSANEIIDSLNEFTIRAADGVAFNFWLHPDSFPGGTAISVFHTPLTKFYYNATSGQTNFNFDGVGITGPNLNEDSWNHVRVEVLGNTGRIFVNNTQSGYGTLLGNNKNIFDSDHVLKLGYADADSSIADHASRGFTGYLDQFNIDSISSITGTWNGAPDSADPGSIKAISFDKVRATGTALASGGKLTSITITNPGSGYDSAPTVSIEAPQKVEFDRGEVVEQTFASGVKMSAEVVKQRDSDAALYVTHVGADDGKFHTFVAGRDITGKTSNAVSTLKSTSELNNLSDTEDNTDFDDAMEDFIDFSENNPFGDPE